jgi:hypothetical protein
VSTTEPYTDAELEAVTAVLRKWDDSPISPPTLARIVLEAAAAARPRYLTIAEISRRLAAEIPPEDRNTEAA